MLEKKLQRQLDFPGAVRQAGYSPEGWDSNRQDRGRSELRLVKEVEKLGAKLKVEALISRPEHFFEQ